jgi:hypothetical protein
VSDGPRCIICGAPIEPIPHEHRSFWLKRTSCSSACRNELRSRSFKSKLKARVAIAVESWRPSVSVSRHAQIHNVPTLDLRTALLVAGHRPVVAKPGPAPTKLPKKRRGPGEDPLLSALLRVYGPRIAPIRKAA